MRRRRDNEGFSLAFLDIMSCGLGAIVLVFMLVKHNIDKSWIETSMVEADLTRLEQEATDLRRAIGASRADLFRSVQQIEEVSPELTASEKSIKRQQALASKQQSELDELKRSIETIQPPKPPDVVENENIGEQQYLIGLSVEGQRIAILVDASASMTDQQLIEVIKRKANSDAVKQKGPKWERTKRIVGWLLARLPEDSEVAVVGFNSKAYWLTGKSWQPSKSGQALGKIVTELDNVVPTGPTNLEVGLRAISDLRPTNVYFITDGLPTSGSSSYKSLNPFAQCSSLWGSASTISGECRARLFRHTVSTSRLDNAVPVSVILLPLEGDPVAPAEFWAWTAATGGLLMTPTVGWP